MPLIKDLAQKLIEQARDELTELVEANAEMRVAEGADLTVDLMKEVEKEGLLALLAEMKRQVNER